jgi:hypothetical protein
MAFFYPKFFEMIDWSKGYEMLDKELQAITTVAMIGKRVVDKLARVYLRQGGEQLLLIHIEVQGEKESEFPERLFIYYYRFFDRYKKPIITLAVLTDDQLSWRPNTYQAHVGDMEIITFRFFTTKLIDYREQRDLLEQTNNPFGVIVLAHLAALETRKNLEERFNYKFSLTKRLYERGLGRDTILTLYRFIDWVITLPEDLGIRYNESIHELEEARAVRYITTAERIGMEKGKREGRQEGIYLLLLDQLEYKFGILSDAYRQRLAQANPDVLFTVSKRLLEAKHLEDVFDTKA